MRRRLVVLAAVVAISGCAGLVDKIPTGGGGGGCRHHCPTTTTRRHTTTTRRATTTTARATTTTAATTTSSSTTAATTTTIAATTTTATTTTTAPTTTTTQPGGRPAFLSYPHQSSPTTINGGTNVVVTAKTWQGMTGKTALVISGAHNVYIHDVDFADNGGDIFLINDTGQIRVEDVRARNTGDGTIGSGHGNVIQLNNTWDDGTGGIRRVDALGGDTEDMISIFKSGGVDAAHPLIIENNHLESPLTGALAWSSGSGTGVNLADGGGHDIIARNNTILSAGQVGMQINEGTRVTITNNIIYGAQRPGSNVGLSQWAGATCACSGNEMSHNRVFWLNAAGHANAFSNSGKAGTIAGLSTNVLQDTTIDPATLHVLL